MWARFGKWSEEAKAAYDPDGSTDLATLVSRANDDFGQAEPARFAANAFAANGSPAYLYRFSYVASALREKMRAGAPHGGEISYVFGTLAAGRGGDAVGRGSGGLADGAELLGQLRQDRRPERSGSPDLAAARSPARTSIFDFRPDGTAGAGPDSRKARLDVTQKNTDAGKRADF